MTGGQVCKSSFLGATSRYHRCAASVDASPDRLRVAIDTSDRGGDLRVSADFAAAPLPAGSPFPSLREARPFAGPLPFTFDYEAETDSIIAIQARRANWKPELVAVTVERIYRWLRGVRHAL